MTDNKGVPGWAIAIIGLLAVAVGLVIALVLNSDSSSASTSSETRTEIYRTLDDSNLVCYDGFSYLFYRDALAPSPDTISEVQDENC